jgi:hypothetical protein
MPADPAAVWMFCRTCSHRGLFVAKPEELVECPQCRKRYATMIMRRQDVEWLHVDGTVAQ